MSGWCRSIGVLVSMYRIFQTCADTLATQVLVSRWANALQKCQAAVEKHLTRSSSSAPKLVPWTVLLVRIKGVLVLWQWGSISWQTYPRWDPCKQGKPHGLVHGLPPRGSSSWHTEYKTHTVYFSGTFIEQGDNSSHIKRTHHWMKRHPVWWLSWRVHDCTDRRFSSKL